MAGTRLLTQASFVLGVLFLLPFALWLVLPPSTQYLWWNPLSGDLEEEGSGDGLLPHPPLLVHLIATSAWLAEAYRAEEVHAALKGVAAVVVDVREMEGEGDGAEGAASLYEKLTAAGEMASRQPLEYLVFLFAGPAGSGGKEDEAGALEMSPLHPYGWVTVPSPSPPAQQSPSSSILTPVLASSIRSLAASLESPSSSPPPSHVPLQQPVRITLLNEDPSVVSCAWDFGRVVRRLENEIARLTPLTHLSFLSEVSNYGALPTGDRFRVGSDYVIATSSLSSWAVEMGSKVLPPSSAHGPTQPLHLVAVCPRSPVKFYDDGGGGSSGNSKTSSSPSDRLSDVIYVPGWGGAVILDSTQWASSGGGDASSSSSSSSTMGKVLPSDAHAYLAEVMVAVIRRWLGLQGPSPSSSSSSSSSSQVQVMTAVEYHGLLLWAYRWRRQQAITKLHNIRQVLDDPRGRVLSPSVIDHWHHAQAALSSSSTFNTSSPSPSFLDSLTRVNAALSHAEAAWSDVSLIPPPHFPIEHHVAVLVPLVVPLIVPLLGGLRSEYTRYRDKVRARKEKAA